MTALPWTEQEIASEVAGSLLNLASYIAHRPESGERLRAAIVEALPPRERALALTLGADIARDHQARTRGETACTATS